MKNKILILSLTSLLFSLSAFAAAPPAQSLLAKSDKARGGLNEGVSWEVEITAIQDGEKKVSNFDVKVKSINILALCTAPARQKGETYLFNDRNLWVYRTNLRKPISVSTRQRLSGQTANGDIATTNYAKDYEASTLGEEVVNGDKAYKLLLKAKSKDLTYDQIHYWVSQKTGFAIQADFLTTEGKAFKRAQYKYDNTITITGKAEPFISEMTITETAFPENKSILVYKNLKSNQFADNIFNVNNLSR